VPSEREQRLVEKSRNYELRITNYELPRGVLAKSLIADFWRSDFGDLQLERTPTQEQATHSVSSRSDNHY
jgi:hypothetical protein